MSDDMKQMDLLAGGSAEGDMKCPTRHSLPISAVPWLALTLPSLAQAI